MEKSAKNVPFPENLYLKQAQLRSGLTVKYLAGKLGVSTVAVSMTINGAKKGINIVPKLRKLLELD